MNFSQLEQRKSRARAWTLVLLCALLWAQLLGLTHRVVHGPQLAGPTVVWRAGPMIEMAEPVQPRVAGDENGFWAALFAAHQPVDCSTLDQLCPEHAAVGLHLPALPVFTPLPVQAVALFLFLSPPGLTPQARGPPRPL